MASGWGVSRDHLASQLSYDKLPKQCQQIADAIAATLPDLIERYPDNVVRGEHYSFYRHPEPLVEVGYAIDQTNSFYVVKYFKAPLKPPVRGFVSYSHDDKEFFDEFFQHASMLHANGYLMPWSDKEIAVGGEWQKAIRDAIEKAGLAVLLVTPGFIASQFIMIEELPLILLKRRNKQMDVYWIPVADCDVTGTGLEELQAMCDAGKPLLKMRKQSRNTVLKDIVQELRSKIEGGTSAGRGTP